MIRGIGIDLVNLERIKKYYQKNKRLADRILTKAEKEYFRTLGSKRKIEYLAGRFAVKEAFSKALGTGLGKLSLQDIETLSDEQGAPIITNAPYQGKIWVSISHTEELAIAQVILEE